MLKALKGSDAVHEYWTALDVGFLVSTVVAFAAVKSLLGHILSDRLTALAIYRIAGIPATRRLMTGNVADDTFWLSNR